MLFKKYMFPKGEKFYDGEHNGHTEDERVNNIV